MERRCEGCEWFACSDETCRKHAPRAELHVDRPYYRPAYWPLVAVDDWCGEFEAKESLRERPLCECGHPKDRHGYGLHRCGVLGCRCGKFEAKKV